MILKKCAQKICTLYVLKIPSPGPVSLQSPNQVYDRLTNPTTPPQGANRAVVGGREHPIKFDSHNLAKNVPFSLRSH
jgi:hypothetical protein